MENTFVIVDVSNLAYRASYGNKELKTREGRFSGHIFGAAASIFALIRNELKGLNPVFCYCYDGKNSKEARRKILPEYKANRIPKDINPLPEVSSLLRLFPGIHIEQDDMEGDDAIAYAVQKRNGKPCIVASGDRDLWALMQYANCKVLSPNLKRFVEFSDFMEPYHLDGKPERIYLAKALFGDSSDGIKGIERLIKKHVAPYLNMEGVDTPEAFYNALGATKPLGLSDKTWDKLQNSKETVMKNYLTVKPMLDFNQTSVVKVGKDKIELIREKLKEFECNSLLQWVDRL